MLVLERFPQIGNPGVAQAQLNRDEAPQAGVATAVLAPGWSEDIRFKGRGCCRTGCNRRRGSGLRDGGRLRCLCGGGRGNRLSRGTLDVAHGLEQRLVAFLGGSIAINLEQFSEVADQRRVGQKLGPIRTGAGILRVAHRG